ncbi:FGGY-family carbohydrate kinase [Curtobacterium sp. MCBD17_003]|uniref:xylulokinase n=1 Tax=Curtobacterium sp. MCBD17_003 TaxID=2175667 RepID=UPI000DA8FACA|nr:FGGY-family carbohydrate kinase [Curtobacterium sp. MCBD17_003]WIE54845.1 FGGY-family carbohydrate kinase [Curtobacterium sp. MCBD17_003]
MPDDDQARQRHADDVSEGRATLGIELGSTRIKATLVGADLLPIASGSHEWENEFVDGRWTYPLDAVWSGLQACYADLVSDVQDRFGVRPTRFRAIGVSAMMHGYLAFDADDELLVPFRTWRNTSTGAASADLTEALQFNIPLRWSVAHLYQAVLDDEPHVADIASLTTLAGYVHWKLTGRRVLGVGDASGVFPIDPATGTYDAGMLATVQERVGRRAAHLDLAAVLPEVLPAGREAGHLTADGARLLDPTGSLQDGIPLCPPEGDAGTGMVATNAVAPRTGNVSVGTSIFAMVVLEEPLTAAHHELDVVTTPSGDAVAMVHCNNGASELAAWARVFGRFAEVTGSPVEPDRVYAALLAEALDADPDAGGLLSSNYLSGEPVTGVEEGRPLLVRSPAGRFTLGNLIRAEVDAAFATLRIGMDVLAGEGVAVDQLLAHGGLFRTRGPAQQLLAAALRVPIAVGATAGEGGPWGMAVLAAYLEAADERSLAEYLATEVFDGDTVDVVQPAAEDVAGFATFLERYRAGLALQPVAVAATPAGTSDGDAAGDAVAIGDTPNEGATP